MLFGMLSKILHDGFLIKQYIHLCKYVILKALHLMRAKKRFMKPDL